MNVNVNLVISHYLIVIYLCKSILMSICSVSYTHLTLPTIYSV